jgi:3-(3-hydroxy-phenyl)propionate hydroxylase
MVAEQRFERIGPFVYPTFQPSLPALDGDSDAARHRVAIVGGGPVGLATALGLARQGIASVVIESDNSVCMGSRAACVSRRSLQIVDRLGALPAFMAKGLPWSDGRSFYGQTEVFRFSMPHDERQKLPPMINLQQYYIEQFLVDAVERRNGQRPGLIDIRWASQVEDVLACDDGVTLTVANSLGRYRLHADWVVACDGGQSFVRRQLGLALHGTGYDGRYVIIDVELPSCHPTERRAWFDPPWNRGSTVLMHRQPDNLWRIDYQLRHGEDAEAALRPENVQDFVQRHLDAIGEGHRAWKPIWTSIYRAGAMTLDRYRHGRVLFAGNAAHAMPIFGVRGLNSGFDDADNLAWKLAFVCQGLARETLLDSYSAERLLAFHANAENAMRSTEFMSPPSRGFDLFREAALSLAEAHRDIAKLVNPRQTQAITYTGSALSSASDAFVAGPPPGAVLDDLPTQGAAGYLCDALGVAFTCLVFAPSREVPAAVAEFAAANPATVKLVRIARGPVSDGVPTLIDADGSVARACDASQGAVYLVRPDGHVAGRWRIPDAPILQRALVTACGSPTPLAEQLS